MAGRTRMATGEQSEAAPRGTLWFEIYEAITEGEPICFRLEDIEALDSEGR